MSNVPYSEDFDGEEVPGLIEPRHFAQNWQRGAANPYEVNGDGLAPGTLVLSITIPTNMTLNIWGAILNALNGAKTFLLVESNLPTVGGVETIHHIADFAAAGSWHIAPPTGPLCVIINRTALPRYFNIYIPQLRLGAVGNNAIGQFVSASIQAILD